MIIASVPSEPMSNRVKSSPTTLLLVIAPLQRVLPAPVTALIFNVFSRVVPYFTARGPAALQAKFPPRVQKSALPGSGGQNNFSTAQ